MDPAYELAKQYLLLEFADRLPRALRRRFVREHHQNPGKGQ